MSILRDEMNRNLNTLNSLMGFYTQFKNHRPPHVVFPEQAWVTAFNAALEEFNTSANSYSAEVLEATELEEYGSEEATIVDSFYSRG